jgi:putative ubiquitin-RnfH superfamily antitoxin RatB of RatAB toxin-antitoxin module
MLSHAGHTKFTGKSPMAEDDISVEVAFAPPDTQALIAVRLAAGSDVESALESSGVYERFPDHDLRNCATGIWGRVVPRNWRLRNGDRVELYRPLRLDPRDARRERAARN